MLANSSQSTAADQTTRPATGTGVGRVPPRKPPPTATTADNFGEGERDAKGRGTTWDWDPEWPWQNPTGLETEHRQIVVWVMKKFGIPHDVAEDAACHVFLAAIKNKPDFAAGSQREAWAKRVSRHYAINDYRTYRGLKTGPNNPQSRRDEHDEA